MAKIVPDMRPEEYKSLLEDIKQRLELKIKEVIKIPIEIKNNFILDGRHRWRAAKETGLTEVPIKEIKLNKNESERDYIIQAAILRRHLTDDQLIALATAVYEVEAKESRTEQQSEAGKKGGRGNKKEENDALSTENKSKKPKKDRKRTEVAKKYKVSERQLQKMLELKKHSPELFAKVKNGDLKLNKALKILFKDSMPKPINEKLIKDCATSLMPCN